METPSPTPPATPATDLPGPRDAPALHCPGCGYNLHGVCTPQRPAGHCPECERAFVREHLLRLLAVQGRGPNLIIGLLVWPIATALFWPLASCFFGALLQDAFGFGVVVILALLLGSCGLTGWWLANALVQAKRAGRDWDEVPAFYRHAFWPWLLFTAAHVVLTVAYFAGGCALVISIIVSS